jgi:hypothetical protein
MLQKQWLSLYAARVKELPANSPVSPVRHPRERDLQAVSPKVAYRPKERQRRVRKIDRQQELSYRNRPNKKIEF